MKMSMLNKACRVFLTHRLRIDIYTTDIHKTEPRLAGDKSAATVGILFTSRVQYSNDCSYRFYFRTISFIMRVVGGHTEGGRRVASRRSRVARATSPLDIIFWDTPALFAPQ